jgi:cytochrome c biogenesis protein CcdA/thiol-disulfide isomerase/thioredoxin
MPLLVVFAFVAGAGTALSPCVLPVLPAVLAAGVTGGSRRPLGVVLGLAASFTFATVALVYVIDSLGLPNDLTRTIAIAVLAFFGVSLLFPPASARIEAWLSRVVPAPARGDGAGFGSGLLVGASLGFVYAPCAGPILAGVITVSAAQDFTVGRLAVALAYALGSAAVLFAVIRGGRGLTDRFRPYRGRIQAGMGAVMVAVAVVMATDLDLRFERAIAHDLPSALVSPTAELERSPVIAGDLSGLRGGGHARPEAGVREAALGEHLPDLGPAPDFTGTQEWFNTPSGEPLDLGSLRGHVVLVDFWTYTCINCIRTLPYVEGWYRRYHRDGLVVVGVHTPEFPFERDAGNVERAIADNGLTYPVVQDNDYGTWNAYGNQFWPAKYLIDASGEIRYVHFGEGEYDATESAIRGLLASAGAARLGGESRVRAQRADPNATTPESYLGAARADRFANGPITAGLHDYAPVPTGSLADDHLAYGGAWRVTNEGATSRRGASLELSFQARRVFLVLGAEHRPTTARVELDGRPLPDALAGADVHAATVRVTRRRLYRLVDLPRAGRHVLTLRLRPGVSGYAFTFG